VEYERVNFTFVYNCPSMCFNGWYNVWGSFWDTSNFSS